MPTYDYRCEACDHQFEHFQSMSSKLLRTCPECGKKKLKRLIGGGGGLLFKGSGFYITDYRSDSYKKAAEKGKSEGGSSDPKKESSSSKKPSSKPGKSGKSKSSD